MLVLMILTFVLPMLILIALVTKFEGETAILNETYDQLMNISPIDDPDDGSHGTYGEPPVSA